MPNVIDSNGLQIQSLQEIIDEILDGAVDFPGMRAIYGADINVDPNSPDGQMVHIVAQAKRDTLEFLTQIYNSFDPDQAIGVTLNARCAINGVARNAGTFTQITVTVTADRALTIAGLDTAPLAPFTVSDSTGNQFVLVAAHAFSGAGSADLAFEAKLLGPVAALPNTLTTIVTVQLGVVSVNNASGPTTLGLAEETDYALRIRRAKSVSLPSQGYLEGLVAALIDTTGVTVANVYENDTSSTDGDGIPGHSIWVVVRGGENMAIANAIYVKRNAGCGMKGSVSVNVLQVDGSYFTILFDRPVDEDLYISFDVTAITGSVDPTFIRNQLLAQLNYGINQPADTTSIVSLIRAISPNASVSNEGVSDDDITYVPLLSPSTIDRQWALAAARIIINGLPG